MDIPPELRYSREHKWARLAGAVATVGITDYAQDALGEVVFVDLPETGSDVVRSEKMGEIESMKAVSDLFSPLSGRVVDVNLRVADNPELANREPYGAGWLLRIEVGDASEFDGMMDAETYEALLAEEG